VTVTLSRGYYLVVMPDETTWTIAEALDRVAAAEPAGR
jgi:hypothetical protein